MIPFNVIAQTRLLTVEEATGMNPKLSPANLSQLQWLPGKQEYVYVADNNLMRGSSATPTPETHVRITDMNMILKMNGHDTLKRFPMITLLNADQFLYILFQKINL